MKTLAALAAILTITVILAGMLCLPVYFLWNWLMPALFGLKHITILQSGGLVLLCMILFKTSIPKPKEK